MLSPHGLIGSAGEQLITEDKLKELAGSDDLHRLDRELDNLRDLELIDNGIDLQSKKIEISPTSLALHIYVRCKGVAGSPVEYFGISPSEMISNAVVNAETTQ